MPRSHSVEAPESMEPPIPVDTEAYRRALRERRFAELAAAAYAVAVPAGAPCEWFVYPAVANGKPPTLVGLGHVDAAGVGVLSFRGTVTWRNWLSNLHVTTTGEPRRHHGFENCWQRLKPQVDTWLERQRPGELSLVGHSLGGAIAQIAAMELAPRWRIRAVVGFGAPFVGRRAFAAAYDATAIVGQPAATLGAVTTTFVFKSDLVRALVLPSLGYVRNGQEIVIDEHGRPSGGYLPWHLQALDVAYDTIMGAGPAAAAPAVAPVVAADRFGYRSLAAAAPPLTVRGAIDALRPFAAPFVKVYPPIQAALLGAGALLAAWLARGFLARDASYHSLRDRYVAAMTERVKRWEPLAFQEHGDALLAQGRADEALPYLSAAVRSAETEARALRPTASAVHQWAWRPRLARAAALVEVKRYQEAIADLTTLVDGDGDKDKSIRIPTDADGRFAVTPRVVALQRRASAFELAGQLRAAMGDHARLAAMRPDFGLEMFATLSRRARRAVGADNALHTLFEFRKALVEAERETLLARREASFRANMAATWRWAHARSAVCAYRLGDFDAAVAAATKAIALDAGDGTTLHLRGVAQARLQRREEALSDLSAAIAIDPGNAAYHYARDHIRSSVGSQVRAAAGDPAMAPLEVQLHVGEKELIEADLRRALEPAHAMAETLLLGTAPRAWL